MFSFLEKILPKRRIKQSEASLSMKPAFPDEPDSTQKTTGYEQVLNQKQSRRKAMGTIFKGLTAGTALASSSCSPFMDAEKREEAELQWDEYFKGHYKLMTDQEKEETVQRLTRLHAMKTQQQLSMSYTPDKKGVLFGYAFNISKCRGYMDCVNACVKENKSDRKSK